MRGVGRQGGGVRSMRYAALAAACALGLASLTAGCSGNGIGGYDGNTRPVETLAVDKRLEPVQLTGKTLTGKPWSLADQRGKVVVVNVWGSWCEPCTAELPLLQKTWTDLSKARTDVAFIGINVREAAPTGQSAARKVGLTYDSLTDESSALGVHLQGKAAATPTTLVLDRQGRIAARVAGQVTSEGLLKGLVEDVANEKT